MMLEFEVHGATPPKKDGASSMWGKESEIGKLIALRRAAFRARGSSSVLRRSIELWLEVHVPDPESRFAGDLDNFITGVCDGLQAAAGAVRPNTGWDASELQDIHPSKVIAIADDAAVVSINATKRQSETGDSWYRVRLVGEP